MNRGVANVKCQHRDEDGNRCQDKAVHRTKDKRKCFCGRHYMAMYRAGKIGGKGSPAGINQKVDTLIEMFHDFNERLAVVETKVGIKK